jgi:CheY-like chemotaxis protein
MAMIRKTHPEASAAPQRSVLVLDDSAERQHLVRTALGSAGYSANVAGDAMGALAKHGNIHPDLIVADLQLPGLDERALARGLLLNADLESVPIVAIAADPEEISRRQEVSDLFDGYVCEPIEPAALLGAVQEILARNAEPAAQAPAADIRAGAPAAADPQGRAEEILGNIQAGLPAAQAEAGTLASLKQLTGSAARWENPGLAEYLRRAQELTKDRTVRGAIAFRSLIRLCRERLENGADPAPDFDHLRSGYIENRIRELPGLADALRRSDFKALSTGGHNIKGTGAAYGFVELTELGQALESAAKANHLLEIEVLLGRMELYLKLVRPAASP